jgi:hypothetical protein
MNDLEERLRRLFADDRLALPSSPDVVARTEAAISRRRLRRLLSVLTAVLVTVAVPVVIRVGLAAPAEPSPTPSPSPSVSAVAWLDEPTTLTEIEATQPPARPAARACAADDLAARAVVEDSEGAGGHILTIVRLANAGSSRCTLSGTVKLAGIRTERGTFFDNVGWKQYPATIDPGEQASVDIETSFACGGAQKQNRNVVMTVLGRSYPLPRARLDSTCVVRVGDWYVLRGPAEPQFRYDGLTATLQAPATVARGSTVDYVVTLTNPGPAAVRLDPCPIYMEEVVKNVGFYRLNCAVAEIAPGASVRFAMRLRVSAETPTGPTHLLWRLAEAAGFTAEVTVPIEVR